MKQHTNEKIRVASIRGNFAYTFYSVKHFYKLNETKDKEEAERLYKLLSTTRERIPSRYMCHSIDTKLINGQCVISKYVIQKGDLYELRKTFSFLKLSTILVQLISAIMELHSFGVVHGDIKPENILISQQDRVLLCDLDHACRPTSLRTINTEFYSPPVGLVREAVHMQKTNTVSYFELYSMVDLYALGQTIHMLSQFFDPTNIHTTSFWKSVVDLFVCTNIRCFFSDDCRERKVRAVDALPIMRYYNITFPDLPVCDCCHRDEFEGCVYCDYSAQEEVRRVESPSDLGV